MDSSGIKFHLTPKLRRYDAGIMELGLIYNNWMAIPPHMSHFSLAGVCVSQCTGVGLPKSGVMVFGSQLHTHGTGRRVETTLVRRDSGAEVMVNHDPHYSTHFQEIRTLETSVRVMPGDALITRCYYDTLARDNVTLGGFGFTEEMCVNYIHYYPRVDLEICKSSISKKDLEEYFQTLKDDEDQRTDGSKSIEENYNAIDWTRRRSHDLEEVYEESHVQMQCHSGDGAALPGNWDHLDQPDIKKHVQARDPCKDDTSSQVDDGMEDMEEGDTEDDDEIRDKRFKMNSFSDTFSEYDAWGYDKRGFDTRKEENKENINNNEDDTTMDITKRNSTKRMDHHVHMGKRKLGSM